MTPHRDGGVGIPLSGEGSSSGERRLSRAWKALAVLVFGLMVFGATVRVHGAGLSCPDWPLCFGVLVPELDFQIFLEWGHRVVAGVVSVLFLLLAGVSLWRPAARAPVKWLVVVAGVALASQVVLGGLTVLHLLADWSVTLHLLTANLFLFLLIQIGRRSAGRVVDVSGASPTVAVVLAVLVVGQAALGGLVSSNHAGTACPDWPSCNDGVWFPTWTGIVGLQLVHRLGAYTVAAMAVLQFLLSTGRARRVAGLAVGLVLAQIAVGVINVRYGIPVEPAILHSALAGLLLQLSAWWAVAVHASRREEAVLPSARLEPA